MTMPGEILINPWRSRGENAGGSEAAASRRAVDPAMREVAA
ncbi:hypothetical protein [Aquamicrobium sp. LC103]|nr:hypothetical protein [Aquamicrobium sp. LC103]